MVIADPHPDRATLTARVFSGEPLPRTPSGKVLKRELRGPAAAEVSAGHVDR
jgi:acyl-coenzyme A synthetase/AMP-(fatty) acid ligase